MKTITLAGLQSLLTSNLDAIEKRSSFGGGGYTVVFNALADTTMGRVMIRVTDEGTFDVSSSGSAPTSIFLESADAYSRAASFIRAAGLTPC